MPAIHENLKALRLASGLTQAAVADAIAVTRQTVSSYESGRTQPDLEMLKRLTGVYRCDLHDVLYGGNRFQKRVRWVVRWALILASIALLGLLAHSVLLFLANALFPMPSGTTVNAETRPLIEMRFSLRRLAEASAGIGAGIFSTGLIALLFPAVTVGHAFSFRKLCLFFAATIAAMFAVTVPFAAFDRVFGLADYLFPMWGSLIPTALAFVVMAAAKLIKRRG